MVDQRLAAALDEEFASDDYAGLTSVIVLSDGRTAYERYFGSEATDHQHVWSITKSIVSTLVGIAIDEGRIGGVEATLAQLLPDHAGVMAPAVAGITLDQLLTMTAGFADDLSSPGDAVASILTKRAPDPGAGFSYANSSAQHVPLEAGVEGFAPAGDVGYGYLWWTSRVDGDAAYSANGSFGQRIFVVLNRDLVVVTQASFTSPSADFAPGDTALNDAIVSRSRPPSDDSADDCTRLRRQTIDVDAAPALRFEPAAAPAASSTGSP